MNNWKSSSIFEVEVVVLQFGRDGAFAFHHVDNNSAQSDMLQRNNGLSIN